MSNDAEEFLSHFGVKGMRWGVVKENRRAKAQTYTDKASVLKTKLSTLEGVSGYGAAKKRGDLKLQIKKEEDTAFALQNGKLTPNQRKAVKYAAVTAAVVATYGAYKLAERGEFTRLASKGKNLLEGKAATGFKKTDKYTGDLSVKDIRDKVVPGINPNYGRFGTKMNCRRATMAYEMRRRGNDVQATKSVRATGQNAGGLIRATSKDSKAPTSLPGLLRARGKEIDAEKRGEYGPFQLKQQFDKGGLGHNAISFSGRMKDSSGKEIYGSESPAHAIFSTLKSQPNGSRGELGVSWAAGGGHSMVYEIVRGKPVVIDAQSGKVFDTPESLASMGLTIAQAAYTRLDNVELNENFLQRWVR